MAEVGKGWDVELIVNDLVSGIGSAPVPLRSSFPVHMIDEWHMEIEKINGLDQTNKNSIKKV
jgi:hypothetical protein